MAWNTEETRRRLKEAAAHEFGEHGLHGTSCERIARRAGVNKERIYHYFGDKDRLFVTVLEDELARVAAAVSLPSAEEGDLGEYAGRVFDYHVEHPLLSRLLQWEALAYGEADVPDEEGRRERYRQKVASVATAQAAGHATRERGPDELLATVLAVAHWWFAFPQVARMVTGASGSDADELARRRALVVETVRRFTAPTPAG